MTQSSSTSRKSASFKVACIAAVGCLVGSYGVNQAFFTTDSDVTVDEVSQAFPEMMLVETSALAEKDAEILSLEADVEKLQAEREVLASENIDLLTDLAGLVIEKTRLENRMPRPETAAYVAMAADPITDLNDTAGDADESARVASTMNGGDKESASTYLALLQSRYDDLNSVQVSDIDLKSLAKIHSVLDAIDREAILFADGMNFDLTDGQREIYEQYRVALLSHQSELMPVLRDAFGPAMRAELKDQGYSMVTSGKGYRIATLKSDQFVSTSEIEEFHMGVHELMVRMRFKEAIYMDAQGVQIHGTVDLNPIPDDSLLINDKIN